MKRLADFKEVVHRCAKCGLCQGVCPIYKITLCDCSVSRGMFVMLQGVLQNKFGVSKTINRYLDLCLKCGACSKFCPSGIDITDVIISAKHEYFKSHFFAKVVSFIQKHLLFKFLPNLVYQFHRIINSFYSQPTLRNTKGKVLYFGGCSSKFKGDRAIRKLLGNIGYEVVNPQFSCCGISLLSLGDLDGFEDNIKNYVDILKKYNIKQIVTTCASCEKIIKNYSKWTASDEIKSFLSEIEVKNIYEYLKDEKFKLKNLETVTYHKPCNIDNYDDIEKILHNIENLNYIKLEDYDKCCGLNGLSKLAEYKIMLKLFKDKRQKIKNTGAKTVLTSCLGCEVALKSYSLRAYKVQDLIEFLAERI
jgi:glycolate oxidase iron-sulfur subunit